MATEIRYPTGVFGSEQNAKDITRLFGRFFPSDIAKWKEQRTVGRHDQQNMQFERKGTYGTHDYFDKITTDRTTGKITRISSVISAEDERRHLKRDIFSLMIKSERNGFSKPGLRIDSVFQSAETMTIPWGNVDPYAPLHFSDNICMEMSIKTNKILGIPTHEHSVGIGYIKNGAEITVTLDGNTLQVKRNYEFPFTLDMQLDSHPYSRNRQLIEYITEGIAKQSEGLWGIGLFTPTEKLAQHLTMSTIQSMNTPSFSYQPPEGIPGA
jgi:hypothetical protein